MKINTNKEHGEKTLNSLLNLTGEQATDETKTKHDKIKEEVLKEVFG